MKIKLMDTGKNVLFLSMILLVLISAVVFVLIKMGTESFEDSLSSDKILKVLTVIEDDGMPISINVIAYYPETKRAAMFNIPANTGLIIQTLDRTDGIGAVYSEKGITSFKKEVEKLTGISIPFYLTCSLEEFSKLTDMLGGISVFIPTPVDINTEVMRVLLPSGSVLLDGDKVRDYLIYEDEADGDNEAASRKQKAVLALFRSINDRAPDIFLKDRFGILKENLHSNISGSNFIKFIEMMSKMDSERLVPQYVTGAVRFVEGKKLLMPFRDGRQLKDVIRQTTAVLGDGEKVTAIRVKDRNTDTEREIKLDGVFVQIGLSPNSDLFRDQLELTARREVKIDETNRTSLPGVYAAGDVSSVPYKQIVIAMGEGAKAALSAFDDRIRGLIAQ